MSQFNVYLRDYKKLPLIPKNKAESAIESSEDETENEMPPKTFSEDEAITGSENQNDKKSPIGNEPEQLFEPTTSLDFSIPLPSSDLLHEIHAFTSDYYKYVQPTPELYRSFTGPALFAIGILMEEYIKSIINPLLSKRDESAIDTEDMEDISSDEFEDENLESLFSDTNQDDDN